MGLAHFMESDAVLMVIDYHLVTTITVDRLLQAIDKTSLTAFVTQYGIEVFDDADLPVILIGKSRDLGRRLILVTVATDGCGLMRSVSVTGHALGLRKDGNIVCAAVTILIRTAARLLEAEPGVRVTGGPGARGEFKLLIESVDEGKFELVKNVGDYFLRGVRDLQAEFPDDCAVQVM